MFQRLHLTGEESLRMPHDGAAVSVCHKQCTQSQLSQVELQACEQEERMLRLLASVCSMETEVRVQADCGMYL